MIHVNLYTLDFVFVEIVLEKPFHLFVGDITVDGWKNNRIKHDIRAKKLVAFDWFDLRRSL